MQMSGTFPCYIRPFLSSVLTVLCLYQSFHLQTIKAIVNAVCFMPKLDSEILLLKTLNALTAGHIEIKLGLNWKHLLCRLGFVVEEETM